MPLSGSTEHSSNVFVARGGFARFCSAATLSLEVRPSPQPVAPNTATIISVNLTKKNTDV